MNSLVLVGGGGHYNSVVDVVREEGKWYIEGVVDPFLSVGDQVMGYPILGDDSSLEELVDKGVRFVVTVGQIKSAELRIRLVQRIKSAGGLFATVISPRAHIGSNVRVGNGTVVCHDVIINSNACIGEQCILNTRCLIEHDCVVGDFCHISTGAIVNGSCRVANCSFIGSGSIVVNDVDLPEGSFVKAGTMYCGEKK